MTDAENATRLVSAGVVAIDNGLVQFDSDGNCEPTVFTPPKRDTFTITGENLMFNFINGGVEISGDNIETLSGEKTAKSRDDMLGDTAKPAPVEDKRRESAREKAKKKAAERGLTALALASQNNDDSDAPSTSRKRKSPSTSSLKQKKGIGRPRGATPKDKYGRRKVWNKTDGEWDELPPPSSDDTSDEE